MTDELLTALEQARAQDLPDDQWMTTREIAIACDWSTAKVLERLHRIATEGRLEIAKVQRKNLAGDLQRVSAYRLKRDGDT